MTPIQLRVYLQSVEAATLAQIMQALSIDNMLSKQLLGFWRKRGKIKVRGCKSCFMSCEDKLTYYWDSI